MTLLGKIAPQFSAQAIVNGCIKQISLHDFGGMYKILVFYPLDFTFVCPTELQAFQDQLEEFKDRNCMIFGISVDSVYSHLAWLNIPKDQAGIQGITFPLISDITKEITRSYGVLHEEQGIAWRALFLLDQKNTIQAVHMNAGPLGRSVQEILRLLDALQFVEANGEVCPADWKPGQEAINPTPAGSRAYFCKRGQNKRS
jgi:alkyl hydroperoxide reductase subunit AhpC